LRWAAASTWSNSFWNCCCCASVDAPRSKASVPMATRQPSFTAPTTFSSAVLAPSKNTSANSLPPVICSMGTIVTPGCFMGTSR
jgi:hypothetical protein